GHIFLARATVVSASVGTISGSVIDLGTGRPIPGVTIQLFTQLNNTFVGQTTTDANGAYTFTNEPAGFYLVVQGFRSDLVPVSASTLAVTVVANVNSANNNFLDRSTVVSPTVGSITGSVINQATGLGIPGVTIQLLTQLNNTFVGQTTTDVHGAYTFANEPPGSYLVVEGFRSDLVPVSLATLPVSVVAGVNSANNNFLDRVTPQLSTISGSVILDVDHNSVIDVPPAGPDVPIQGVRVVLQPLSGAPQQTFFTDVNGAWAFSGLAAGTYNVVHETPPNFAALPATPRSG